MSEGVFDLTSKRRIDVEETPEQAAQATEEFFKMLENLLMALTGKN